MKWKQCETNLVSKALSESPSARIRIKHGRSCHNLNALSLKLKHPIQFGRRRFGVAVGLKRELNLLKLKLDEIENSIHAIHFFTINQNPILKNPTQTTTALDRIHCTLNSFHSIHQSQLSSFIEIERMSRSAKIFFVVSVALSGGTIWGVHYIQAQERIVNQSHSRSSCLTDPPLSYGRQCFKEC